MTKTLTSKLVQAIRDGKGLGSTINALASEGKIERCTIVMRGTGEKIECNSTWAATDWLKEKGFLESHTALTSAKPVEYDLTW